jgi:hypothetical protein
MAAVFAVVATGVALVFAGQLFRQYAARRRPHALAWGLSLGLYAVASGCVAAGVLAGWTPAVFGVYWVAGALLTVPLLAAGQLLLMDPRRSVLYWTLAGLCAAWAVLFTLMAPFNVAALADAGSGAGAAIPLGREVLGDAMAYRLLTPFNYLFVIVVAGSVWSAVRTRRWGLLLIALGVTVSAAASSMAGDAARTQFFPVLLAAGVALMYGGFVAAGKPSRRRELTETAAA